jgi:hypothetical protein
MALQAIATPAKVRGADSRKSPAAPLRALAQPESGQVLQRCACGGGCPRCRGADAGLTVSRPGDADEVAAERMAGVALRPGAGPGVLRRAAGGPAGVDAALPSPLGTLRGGGQPLPDAVRADLEPRFGTDFGAVRVHADAPAAALAERYGAQAFTVGRDVVFGAGRYAPETGAGRGLLAHELAHVAGQRGRVDGSRLQAKVVDDDAHFPCRTTPTRAGRMTAADLAAREVSAATRAEAAATAIRATPITEATRGLLWTRFGLDYNDPRTRCRMIATLAERFDSIADGLRNTEVTYRCAATGEPPGPCTDDPANAWTTVGLFSSRIDLCDAFWGRGLDAEAQSLLHEWGHYLFVRRGLGDDPAVPFDTAACYAAFAFQVSGGPAVWRDDLCPPRTDAVPALDAARVAAPCPGNTYTSLTLTGGYLGGLPGLGGLPTAGVGLQFQFPITRMHDWEASFGPRITAAFPGESGGSRPPPAFLLGLRTGLEFRYRPWRFGANVGGYAEGGAAVVPSQDPANAGKYTAHPYAVGGLTGGIGFPIGRQTAFRLFAEVGAGAGYDRDDKQAFGIFQAGLGAAFEFR